MDDIVKRTRKQFTAFFNQLSGKTDEEKVIIEAGIAPTSKSKEVMTLLGLDKSLLEEENLILSNVADRKGYIENRLKELESTGEIDPKEQALDIINNHNYRDRYEKETTKLIVNTVMSELREGNDNDLLFYSMYLIPYSDPDDLVTHRKPDFDLSQVIFIGYAAGLIEIEAYLRNELETIKFIEGEQSVDNQALASADKDVILKTTQMIVVLDALGVIDLLIKQSTGPLDSSPNFTLIAKKVALITQHKATIIRPILRDLKRGGKNDPYNSKKNVELRNKIIGQYDL